MTTSKATYAAAARTYAAARATANRALDALFACRTADASDAYDAARDAAEHARVEFYRARAAHDATLPKTVTITRRTRSIGYGCTSRPSREGGIQTPRRELAGMTPRIALRHRLDEIRACGGHPDGGNGAYYRERFWIGDLRVVNGQDLLWNLQALIDGDLDSFEVEVAPR